jgi:hypothetical protein
MPLEEVCAPKRAVMVMHTPFLTSAPLHQGREHSLSALPLQRLQTKVLEQRASSDAAVHSMAFDAIRA